MFTVLICSNKVINDCKTTYGAFMKPLLAQDDWTFCAWNHKGDTLNEAVPELRRSTAKYKDWRAVIVLDETIGNTAADPNGGQQHISHANPFDIANSVSFESLCSEVAGLLDHRVVESDDDQIDAIDEITPEQNQKIIDIIQDFRERKEKAFANAIDNPVTKLATWLLGAANKTMPPADPDDDQLPEVYEGEKTLLHEMERYHARCYKVMHEVFSDEPQIFNVPRDVILVSERNCKNDDNLLGDDKCLEMGYSRFYEDNMYPHKLRYVLYDMIFRSNVRDPEAYFNFLTFLLTYAVGEHPTDTLKPERVYSVEAVLDKDKLSEMCHRYIFKLQETKNRIDLYSQKLDAQKDQTIDNNTATKLFESDVIVPVKISSDFNTNTLMCSHRRIGLATDCPSDENTYWNDQHKSIRKSFSRYLREPRRAVKSSVLTEFREMNSIDDTRVLRLNDDQREDVWYRLIEEEGRMVRSAYSQINNDDEYNKQLDKADREIRSNISNRMTRGQTLLAGLIGTVAFALGFVPWIIEGIRAGAETTGHVFSISSFLVGVGICLLIILMAIFSFRMKLVGLFKAFNRTMDGVLKDVALDLDKVSQYLSHACNVMREFSVLNAIDSDALQKRRILNMHTQSIDEKIETIYDQFYQYIDEELIEEHAKKVGQGEAYDYDFTKPEQYAFEMPYVAGMKTIPFMQAGCNIDVPIEYLKEVTMRREELYE